MLVNSPNDEDLRWHITSTGSCRAAAARDYVRTQQTTDESQAFPIHHDFLRVSDVTFTVRYPRATPKADRYGSTQPDPGLPNQGNRQRRCPWRCIRPSIGTRKVRRSSVHSTSSSAWHNWRPTREPVRASERDPGSERWREARPVDGGRSVDNPRRKHGNLRYRQRAIRRSVSVRRHD